MSLIKYAREARPDVHWGRVELDGFPFRGKEVPLLKEEEFADRTTKTFDAKNGTFYTGDKEQNSLYLEVMDKAANGWWSIIFIERWRNPGDNHMWIYIEWIEGYVQAK